MHDPARSLLPTGARASIRLVPGLCLLLALSASARAQTVDFGGVTLRVNTGSGSGAPSMDGAELRMSNGEYGTARSALSTSTFNLAGAWSTRYRIRFSCVGVGPGPDEPQFDPETGEELDPIPGRIECPGDGIAFVATGGADTQVGGGGFDLGYASGTDFTASLAFGVKSFWDFVDVGANGAWTRDCCTDPKLFNDRLQYLDAFDVAIDYDGTGQLLTQLVRVSTNTVVHSGSTAWVAPAWAASARVGFTASTGSAAEQSWVSDWSLRPTPATTVPEPGTWALIVSGLVPLAWAQSRRRRHRLGARA